MSTVEVDAARLAEVLNAAERWAAFLRRGKDKAILVGVYDERATRIEASVRLLREQGIEGLVPDA